MKLKFFLHKSILLKKIVFASFIFFNATISVFAASNAAGEIRSVEFPHENNIYFGAFKSNDTSRLNFIIRNNNPNVSLQMDNVYPTLVITFKPPSVNILDFRYYPNPNRNFPIILRDNYVSDILTFSFELPDQAVLGRYEAMVIMGLADLANNPQVLDTFYFIGKVTELDIDGYDDFVFFDSVFINQKVPYTKEWRVRNTTQAPRDAVNQSFALLSPPLSGQGEFSVEEQTYPMTFYVGNNSVYRSWKFSYSPNDTFRDSAQFKLFFQPEPETNPTRIDSTSVKLYGVGVSHSLDILEADCEIHYDTIDVGRIRVGQTKTAKISLLNRGNIVFGLKEQHIWDEINDEQVDYFKIEKPFCDTSNNPNQILGIGDKDSFEISFTPTSKGFFTARYVIMNDFKERKIHSSNPEDFRKVFILKGIGTEPTFNVNIDTVDFGNVSYSHSDCETKKDIMITIMNDGNSDLIVTAEVVDDPAFRVKSEAEPALQDLLIPANSEAKYILTFTATQPEKIHNAKLLFHTNDKKNEEAFITLLARSIPPIEADLTIPPNLSNKPGSLLAVPILLTRTNTNENVSEYGTSYSFDLSFNPALLEFVRYATLNTASEGCNANQISVESLSDGQIRVEADKGNSFLDNNILLYLHFRTFLGNSESTELALGNARIGNNSDCSDFMQLKLNNGRYSTDSICGLEQKLHNLSNLQFRFELEHTLVTSELNYSFTLPFSTSAKLEIFSVSGERVTSEEYFLLMGDYSKIMKLNNLTKNIYYCVFTSGLFKKSVSFVYE